MNSKDKEFQLEGLWPDKIPEIGDPGECTHCEPFPGLTSDCKLIKDKIVIRKKGLIRAMIKKDASANIHRINENLHNIERLKENWENLHFNPPYKWTYVQWIGNTPVYYHELRQKYARWTNSNYDLQNLEDFPPLSPLCPTESSETKDQEGEASDLGTSSANKNEEENIIIEKEEGGEENDELLIPKQKRQSLTYAQLLSLSLNSDEETCTDADSSLDEVREMDIPYANFSRYLGVQSVKKNNVSMKEAEKMNIQRMRATNYL